MKYYIKMLARFVIAWTVFPFYIPILGTLYLVTALTDEKFYLINRSLKCWLCCASVGVLFPSAVS